MQQDKHAFRAKNLVKPRSDFHFIVEVPIGFVDGIADVIADTEPDSRFGEQADIALNSAVLDFDRARTASTTVRKFD